MRSLTEFIVDYVPSSNCETIVDKEMGADSSFSPTCNTHLGEVAGCIGTNGEKTTAPAPPPWVPGLKNRRKQTYTIDRMIGKGPRKSQCIRERFNNVLFLPICQSLCKE